MVTSCLGRLATSSNLGRQVPVARVRRGHQHASWLGRWLTDGSPAAEAEIELADDPLHARPFHAILILPGRAGSWPSHHTLPGISEKK